MFCKFCPCQTETDAHAHPGSCMTCKTLLAFSIIAARLMVSILLVNVRMQVESASILRIGSKLMRYTCTSRTLSATAAGLALALLAALRNHPKNLNVGLQDGSGGFIGCELQHYLFKHEFGNFDV